MYRCPPTGSNGVVLICKPTSAYTNSACPNTARFCPSHFLWAEPSPQLFQSDTAPATFTPTRHATHSHDLPPCSFLPAPYRITRPLLQSLRTSRTTAARQPRKPHFNRTPSHPHIYAPPTHPPASISNHQEYLYAIAPAPRSPSYHAQPPCIPTMSAHPARILACSPDRPASAPIKNKRGGTLLFRLATVSVV